MKNKLLIFIICLLITILLLTPFSIKIYEDGGTKSYQSLTYKIVKWHKLEQDPFTKVYWFPNHFKSIDALWDLEKGQ